MSRPDQVVIDQAVIDDGMDAAEELLIERLPPLDRLSTLPSSPRTQPLHDGWVFLGLIVAYLVGGDARSFAVRWHAATGERRLVREWD